MEVWKDIPGYVGLYQASSEGRIRSLQRVLPSAVAAGVRHEKRVLKPSRNKQGRLGVVLSKGGVTEHFQVHRLVLDAFEGPRPEGHECRHLDGDCTNNRPGNLQWNTHTVNMQDKQIHGTERQGMTHPYAKLTDDDVRAIRGSSETQSVLAQRYGMSQVSISNVRSRKTWKHVE